MNDSIILILAIIISGTIGAYIGVTISKLKSKSQQSTLEERNANLSQQLLDAKLHADLDLEKLQNSYVEQQDSLKKSIEKTEGEREEIRREKEFLHSELTRKQADFENLSEKHQEQKAEIEKLQEKFTKEFENLANKILDEKSSKFTLQNKENIDAILKPLQDKIQNFEKRVEETNKEDITRTADLRRQ